MSGASINRIRATPDRTSMCAAWLPTPPNPTTTTKRRCKLAYSSSPKNVRTREKISFRISSGYAAALLLSPLLLLLLLLLLALSLPSTAPAVAGAGPCAGAGPPGRQLIKNAVHTEHTPTTTADAVKAIGTKLLDARTE